MDYKCFDRLLCFLFGHDWGPYTHVLTCFHQSEVVCPHWTQVCRRRGCGKTDLGHYHGPVNAGCRRLARLKYCQLVSQGGDRKKLLPVQDNLAGINYNWVHSLKWIPLVGLLVELVLYIYMHIHYM